MWTIVQYSNNDLIVNITTIAPQTKSLDISMSANNENWWLCFACSMPVNVTGVLLCVVRVDMCSECGEYCPIHIDKNNLAARETYNKYTLQVNCWCTSGKG